MLTRKNRLTNSKEIETLFRSRRAFHSPTLTMRWARTKNAHSRFAVVVGNKVSKKAVVRNKIKRRVREVIQKNIPGVRGGVDAAVVARAEAATATFKKLKEDLTALFRKANLTP